jgi:hypothetical protein
MIAAPAATVATWIQGHWGIENALHWVRDVVFDEDRHQLRTGNGPQVMATLRNTTIWGSPRTVDIEGGLPGGSAERMFTWRLQEDHSRRSTGLRPLIG